MALRKQPRVPLTVDEREGIVLAVNSAFRKLKNLYARIVPVFEDFGSPHRRPASSRATYQRRSRRRSFNTVSRLHEGRDIVIFADSIRIER
jgi:hypothetical protein